MWRGTNTASPQLHPTLIVASVNSNQKIFLKKMIAAVHHLKNHYSAGGT